MASSITLCTRLALGRLGGTVTKAWPGPGVFCFILARLYALGYEASWEIAERSRALGVSGRRQPSRARPERGIAPGPGRAGCLYPCAELPLRPQPVSSTTRPPTCDRDVGRTAELSDPGPIINLLERASTDVSFRACKYAAEVSVKHTTRLLAVVP
jgi:hypothetical protein